MSNRATEDDAIFQVVKCDELSQAFSLRSIAGDRECERDLHTGKRRNQEMKTLLLNQPAHRQQLQHAIGTSRTRCEALQVDAMRQEMNLRSNSANLMSDIGIACHHTGGVSCSLAQHFRRDFASITRVCAETKRHAQHSRRL